MKVRLTKRAKVWHDAGDVVELSPAEANFLLAVKAAEPVEETKKATKKK